MKFWKYILTLAVLTFGAVSCVEEAAYVEGEPDLEGCYGVYFPAQEATGSHTFDPSMDRTISFTVARKDSKGEITVPVEVTASAEGVFSVGELKFADGQSETTLTVDFPNAETGVTYKLSLGLTNPQYASKYVDGDLFIDFSVLIVSWEYFLNPKTGEKAKFTFNQAWWGEVHTGYVKYYDVNGVRTCVTETDPLTYDDGSVGYGFWGTGAKEGEGEITFTWYTKNFSPDGKQLIELPPTPVFVNSGELVSAYDYYAYFTVANPQAVLAGMSFIDFAAKYWSNYPLSYYDGNGGIIFNIQYYIKPSGSGWYGEGEGDVSLLADGFTRVDYSLKVEDDYTVSGTHPVYFTAGPDVANIKYIASEGELNAVQIEGVVAAIVDGTAENVAEIKDFVVDEETGEKAAAAGVKFEKSGKYTVVAVAYDAEGNAQNTASVVIDYVASDDDSFDVAVNVFTEPTPSRYADEGHTALNSFSFTIYGGTELTDVKMNIFKTADVEKAGVDAVVASVRSVDSVTEDVLADINTTAGYTTLATGLSDGTSYTVVVWGTNGYQTVTATAEFTTEKNPEVFKSLGMGTYTEDILTTFFDVPNLTYEVEIEESAENPGKYRLVNPYGKAYPYNEPGDWDDSNDYFLTVHAENPDCVYIEAQPLGFDWGYGMFGIYSLAANMIAAGSTEAEVIAAGAAGTLKDGVITFPVKTLLISMANYQNGGWFYANANGAFKIVLPSAVADTPAVTTSVAGVRPTTKNNAETFEGNFSRFIPIEREATTVSFSQETIPFVKKETGRDIAPAQMSKMTLN